MTLADLLATLQSRELVPASRAKDLKTSLRYLATALGCLSPDACPVGAACQEEATWGKALDTHFAALTAQGRTISAETRRNTRNNLRVTFRLAETHGLLPTALPMRLLARSGREAFRRGRLGTTPYPETYHGSRNSYTLQQAEWPPEIAQAWAEYRTRCGVRVRETSFYSYRIQMQTYLGYFVNVQGRTPTVDDLFNKAELNAFVRWHAARMGRSLSRHGRQVAIMIATMSKVLDHPTQHTLADFRRELKMPTPVHLKRNHWVSLAELEAVAEDCLREGRTPVGHHGKPTRFYGSQRAGRFQVGLVLKLLVRLPLRQRNIREMQLDRNLAKDRQTGHWKLEFRGDELKVGNRGALVNEYTVDLTEYCPEWIPLLEEFLQVHRPKLPNAEALRCVFIGTRGKPYSGKTLHLALSEAVAMRTGQRFYPHLVRSIWASEFLERTGDFTSAAVLLGDQVSTVMAAYYDIFRPAHHAKAKAFLGTALHTG